MDVRPALSKQDAPPPQQGRRLEAGSGKVVLQRRLIITRFLWAVCIT